MSLDKKLPDEARDTGYFCSAPFINTEFQHRRTTVDNKLPFTQYLCCPAWNPTNIAVSENLDKNWNSPQAVEVREEMLKGNFKNCSTSECPHLNTFLSTGKSTGPIQPLSKFEEQVQDYSAPSLVRIANDFACNLQCPSCRLEFIPNSDKNTSEVANVLDGIKKYYKKTLKGFSVSGAGDPFYSTPIREHLLNMDENTYPNLEYINIVTNGVMLTPKLWEKLKHLHPYIKHIEFSIDAATKDTYENKTRLRGNWDRLIENMKYIAKQKTVKTVSTSFVVQQANYHEMEDFIHLTKSIFKRLDKERQLYIKFYRVLDWAQSKDHGYGKMQVWRESHPEYSLFRKEVEKVKGYMDQEVIINFN